MAKILDFDGSLPADEINTLLQIVRDANAIERFATDRDYAADMKRRLIYERVKYIRESMNQWINRIEANPAIDHNFVFREDNAVSTDDI